MKRNVDSISLSVHCPKCRRRMVLRQGPEHHFYGCTGYPDECRHTLTIAQAQGLHKHIEEKRCAHKGKVANKTAQKRVDLRAAVRVAESALHRNEMQRQEVSSNEGAYRAVTEKETNHRGKDYLEQSDPLKSRTSDCSNQE